MNTPLGAVLAAATVAGAMLLSAGAAHADKSQVQIDCEKAGGSYTQNSTSSESCCFHETVDSAGHHCKEYLSGEYVGNSILVHPNNPRHDVTGVVTAQPLVPASPALPPVGAAPSINLGVG
jgi:hypothetical protein